MYERVLIIDDSQEIREFLSDYVLKPKGFEVLMATNGLMGLEMAIAKEPDLIIIDQQMPRLTGLEVLQKLRERDITIPAILVTAHGSEDTAVAAFRLGIRDYIIKPIDVDEISESVDRALRESRLQRERDQLVQLAVGVVAQREPRAGVDARRQVLEGEVDRADLHVLVAAVARVGRGRGRRARRRRGVAVIAARGGRQRKGRREHGQQARGGPASR